MAESNIQPTILDINTRNIIADFNFAPITRQDYLQVSVLLLTWEENDLIGIEKEVSRLEKVFKKDYNFKTSQFQIPNEHSQLLLQKYLTDFIIDSSNEGSLVIVYYGGHGDVKDGKSIWAAKQDPESPELYWSQVQQTVFGGKGDVLIILDCCHAAAAMRGASFTSLRRIEVMAASGLHRTTPAPGRKSFTALMTDILKDVFDDSNKKKEVGATQLVRKLMDLPDTKIKETVYHVSLTSTAETNNTGIVLKRYTPPDPEGFGKRPVGTLIFHATLTSDPTGLEIANWLKRSIPASIGSIDIAGIFSEARQLQTNLKTADGELVNDGVLGKLSQPAKDEILSAIAPLEESIGVLDRSRKAGRRPGGGHLGMASVMGAAASLQAGMMHAQKEIEAAIILDGGLKEAEKQDIFQASEKEEKMMIDPATVQLQDIIEKGSSTALEVPREKLKYLSNKLARNHRMRLASYTHEGKEVTVLVEFTTFDEDSPSRQAQFRTVASRLTIRPKRGGYLTMEGLGYMEEPDLSRSGLVFKVPDTYARRLPVSLYDLYKERPIVPLEDRIALAHNLAVALDNLHIVGWLHKAIDSNNVFFFFPKEYPEDVEDGSKLDMSSTTPYFFGFEYSRHETAESSLASDFSVSANIFRHPQRWGKPTVKFTKYHDIYSLGVLIFEIALWTRVEAVVEKWQKQRVRVNEKSVLNYITKKTAEEIPHWVGKKVATAIRNCLTFETLTKGKSEVEKRSFFKKEILENLKA